MIFDTFGDFGAIVVVPLPAFGGALDERGSYGQGGVDGAQAIISSFAEDGDGDDIAGVNGVMEEKIIASFRALLAEGTAEKDREVIRVLILLLR